MFGIWWKINYKKKHGKNYTIAMGCPITQLGWRTERINYPYQREILNICGQDMIVHKARLTKLVSHQKKLRRSQLVQRREVSKSAPTLSPRLGTKHEITRKGSAKY